MAGLCDVFILSVVIRVVFDVVDEVVVDDRVIIVVLVWVGV